jgi:hypothetical protein
MFLLVFSLVVLSDCKITVFSASSIWKKRGKNMDYLTFCVSFMTDDASFAGHGSNEDEPAGGEANNLFSMMNLVFSKNVTIFA